MWTNNQRNGFGKLTFPNGDKYEGNYENGLKNGEGSFYWADGSYYKG